MARSMRIQLVMALVALACDTPSPVTKTDARATGGRGPSGEDLCYTQRWYGDGECDDFCVLPDPDCERDAGIDAGAGDAGHDGGSTLDAAADATTSDGSVRDGGTLEAGAAIDAGALLDGALDAGAGVDGSGPDGGPDAEAPSVLPLPEGFRHGSCSNSLEWGMNVLRGPASWATARAEDWRVWPVELDEGQTLVAQIVDPPLTAPELTPMWPPLFLGGGACKGPGGGSADSYSGRLEHTASRGPENAYLSIMGTSSGLRVDIIGPSRVSRPVCDGSDAVDVSLGTPFLHGDRWSSYSELPMRANARFAHGSVSCTGIRHMGADLLWRVHLSAGQTLQAGASNVASMGPDPMAWYLVPDCSDLSVCSASMHGGDGAGLSYVATRDEILYLILDLFANDRGATWVSVEVLP